MVILMYKESHGSSIWSSKIEPLSVKETRSEVKYFTTRLIGAPEAPEVPEVETALLSYQIVSGTRQITFLYTDFIEKRRKLKRKLVT